MVCYATVVLNCCGCCENMDAYLLQLKQTRADWGTCLYCPDVNEETGDCNDELVPYTCITGYTVTKDWDELPEPAVIPHTPPDVCYDVANEIPDPSNVGDVTYARLTARDVAGNLDTMPCPDPCGPCSTPPPCDQWIWEPMDGAPGFFIPQEKQ
jgi:hypothetical protein